ncbi:MAG: metal-sensitive transcriptional regulator [Anaerolineae bacterium]|nr:metal-sensitive transcriptional regulator [Anaerolineae bacterium]
MKLSDNTRQNLLTRLKRIEGQTRGVQNMLEDERECREIIQQLSAIRSALQSATAEMMREYASDCLFSVPQEQEKRQELVEDLINLLGKA